MMLEKTFCFQKVFFCGTSEKICYFMLNPESYML